jgi:dTMP kinase
MGFFLVLEGPKGVGKTTAVNSLRQRLSDTQQYQVVLTKEPTAKFDLDQEAQLLGADLALVIAQDRAVHVEEVIEPALASGATVICDRYILSSLVFHSIDGVPVEEIWRLNQAFPLPDANLILLASAPIISSRRGARSSSTRLETAHTPEAEYEAYVHFGQVMQCRGSALKILSNETPEQLEKVLDWIMDTVQEAAS